MTRKKSKDESDIYFQRNYLLSSKARRRQLKSFFHHIMEEERSILELKPDELRDLLKWVDSFKLSRCRSKLSRDFSDGVLLAEVLKHEFPNLVELHNYNGCSSVHSKIENWNILNRKVLKKLQIHLKPQSIEKVARAETNYIEKVLHRIMIQINDIKRKNADKNENISSEGSNIMTVKVIKKVNNQTEEVSQKVIQYSIYKDLLKTFEAQEQKTKELQETIDELLIALKSKTEMIDDLQKRL